MVVTDCRRHLENVPASCSWGEGAEHSCLCQVMGEPFLLTSECENKFIFRQLLASWGNINPPGTQGGKLDFKTILSIFPPWGTLSTIPLAFPQKTSHTKYLASHVSPSTPSNSFNVQRGKAQTSHAFLRFTLYFIAPGRQKGRQSFSRLAAAASRAPLRRSRAFPQSDWTRAGPEKAGVPSQRPVSWTSVRKPPSAPLRVILGKNGKQTLTSCTSEVRAAGAQRGLPRARRGPGRFAGGETCPGGKGCVVGGETHVADLFPHPHLFFFFKWEALRASLFKIGNLVGQVFCFVFILFYFVFRIIQFYWGGECDAVPQCASAPPHCNADSSAAAAVGYIPKPWGENTPLTKHAALLITKNFWRMGNVTADVLNDVKIWVT